MQDVSFSEAARLIDRACAGYIASGEIDPTPWLDQISNYFLSAPTPKNGEELFDAMRSKLNADETKARGVGNLAQAEFCKAARKRINDLDQPYPADDGSELGPTIRPYGD